MGEINIEGLSNNRLMCAFMKCCERIYFYKALMEEKKQFDPDEVRRWIHNYTVTRKEIVERGLLDEAFNLN